MTGAAVDLQLEGNLPGAQLLDHTVDCGEWIAFVFRLLAGAPQIFSGRRCDEFGIDKDEINTVA